MKSSSQIRDFETFHPYFYNFQHIPYPAWKSASFSDQLAKLLPKVNVAGVIPKSN